MDRTLRRFLEDKMRDVHASGLYKEERIKGPIGVSP